MKIAVPYHNGYISSHFGQSESFAVFTLNQENQIVGRTLLRPEACGCKSGVGSTLASEGVTIMLAGGIGEGAIRHLYNEGIIVVRGCEGKADDVVLDYVSGKVTDGGQTCSSHQGCSGHSH